MGRNLQSSIRTFFEKQILKHEKVVAVRRIDKEVDDYFIYRVERTGLPPVTVVLADQYLFTEMDLADLPDSIGPDSIVYSADPNHTISERARQTAKEMRIFLGTYGEMLGALNLTNVSKYIPKSQRKASN